MLIPRNENNLISFFKYFIPAKIDSKTFEFSKGYAFGQWISSKKLKIEDFKSDDFNGTIYLVKFNDIIKFIYQKDLKTQIKKLEKVAESPILFSVIRRENIQVVDKDVYLMGNGLTSIPISKKKVGENKFEYTFESWFFYIDKKSYTGEPLKEDEAKYKYFKLGSADKVCIGQKLKEVPYIMSRDTAIKLEEFEADLERLEENPDNEDEDIIEAEKKIIKKTLSDFESSIPTKVWEEEDNEIRVFNYPFPPNIIIYYIIDVKKQSVETVYRPPVQTNKHE